MNRRTFIKRSTFASGVFLVPAFLKNFEILSDDGKGWKNLVVVQLSGGNDGLNTIIPFENGIYYNKRASISIPKNEIVKLNDFQGLNPSMSALKEIYDNGWMCILNSVGYPNPDRSHFRSFDIWHTASSSSEYLTTGWIGRYLDSSCKGCENPYNAITVDSSLTLALKGETKKGIAVNDTKQLYNITREPFFKNLIEQQNPNKLGDDNLDYLYKTMIETHSSAEYIFETQKTYENKYNYPQTQFAKDLKNISTFINSGLKTRIYYVSLNGFDTHTNQRAAQDRLLKEFAEGISAFLKDLKQTNKLDKILVMTFSEFGRRVEQNASSGTDHGTGGNMFIFGGGLKKQGIFNEQPDLSNLEDGDIKFKIDFRSVYATVIDKWLSASSKQILNKEFNKLDFI